MNVGMVRRFSQVLPSLVLAFAMAIAVWVTAETATNPFVTQDFPRPVEVEIIGLDPGIVLVTEPPFQVTVKIIAPQNIWAALVGEPDLVTALVDVSGLGPGVHDLEVKAQISPTVRGADIVSIQPAKLSITLENLATRSYSIKLVRQGEPSIGFRAEEPNLSQDLATVSGPESEVLKVTEVRASLNLGDAHESINTSIPLQALDKNEQVVENVTINPERVIVNQPITQRGGFRSDLVVKPVFIGRIVDGYRVTNISVFPPAVTVFSANPQAVNELPGYVDSLPINLEGASDDLEIPIGLSLPPGISLVGDQNVVVQVGIAAIESSLQVPNKMVEVIGLSEGLAATVSPERVDIILSGPLPLLDGLLPNDVRVTVDLAGLVPGVYQMTPNVELQVAQLRVDSILPDVVEVEITIAPTPTVTPTATPRP
jgi:YbbR domain-containing protein